MGVKESNRITDGFLTLEGGIDSGFAPSIIQPNQAAWAVNTTMRYGFPQPRPGWCFRSLAFSDDSQQTNFETGLFQGAGTYLADNGDKYLAVSISGRVYTIKVTAANKPFKVQELTSATYTNQPNQPLAWFCQAERWLIVQNMIDRPLLWNGSGVQRSNVLTQDPHQVPIGGPMAYGRGRLAVASGNAYTMGDLVNSDPTLGRDTVINFTENDYLNEGGSFVVPGGPITGMIYPANQDETLGIGNLLVFTEGNVFQFDAPIDRTVWKTLTYPIQRYAAVNYGSVNQWSLAVMNGDVAYRAGDGIRTIQTTRRDEGTWGQTPISRQVIRALRYDTGQLLPWASAVNFDNRLLMTVQPQQIPKSRYPSSPTATGVYHRGLVSLDYHLVSGMGLKAPPAWEGVWTGLQLLRILTLGNGATQRCFVFALTPDNRICLWEITKENIFDFDGADDVPIQWILETKSMTAGQPNGQKTIEGLEYWYDQVAGVVSSTVKYRPDLEQVWWPWGGWDDCARYRNCDDQVACSYHTTLDVPYYVGQARSRRGIWKPTETPDVQRGGYTVVGYEFQLRFENSGWFRFKRPILVMSTNQENQYADQTGARCEVASADSGCDTNACKGVEFCDPNDYSYSIYGGN